MTRARGRRSEEVIVGLFRRGAKERDVVETSADVVPDEEPGRGAGRAVMSGAG